MKKLGFLRRFFERRKPLFNVHIEVDQRSVYPKEHCPRMHRVCMENAEEYSGDFHVLADGRLVPGLREGLPTREFSLHPYSRSGYLEGAWPRHIFRRGRHSYFSVDSHPSYDVELGITV